MNNIDDILDALASGALASGSAGSDVVEAFERLATGIAEVCVALGEPFSREAYELFQRNTQEPHMWRAPLGRALEAANAANNPHIMYAAQLLAVRLTADQVNYGYGAGASIETTMSTAYSEDELMISEHEAKSYHPAGDTATSLPDAVGGAMDYRPGGDTPTDLPDPGEDD